MKHSLHDRLQDEEKNYEPALGLYGHVFNGPGYHTKVPNGTWAHATRENMYLVHSLLRSGEPAWVQRAHGIMERLLLLQDRDPVSKTFGIWSWLVEEPLPQMAPPDWNWADFLGLKIAQILADFGPAFPPALLDQARLALRDAAHSIFRRNVDPGYTNIAVKGGVVTCAAGEMLGEPWLVEYGRRRLASVVDHFEYHGGFNEYNSPGYGRLVVDIIETGLHIVRDEATRASLIGLWEREWRLLSAHFHPGTSQLVGPQSRAYGDFLTQDWLDFLGERLGNPDAAAEPDPIALAIPPDSAARFAALPSDPYEVTHQHIRREGARSTIGTTWFTAAATLGSASHENTWTQRRPVLAFWRGPEGKPVSLRLRLVKDEKDFASGFLWNAQSGPKVLTGVNFITTGGDFHVSLDRQPGSRYPGTELRLRYELLGEGGDGRDLGEGRYEFSAGNIRAVITTVAASINGVPLVWELSQAEGVVRLDAVHQISGGFIDVPAIADVQLAVGLELVPPGENGSGTALAVTADESTLYLDWAGLGVRVPRQPVTELEASGVGLGAE